MKIYVIYVTDPTDGQVLQEGMYSDQQSAENVCQEMYELGMEFKLVEIEAWNGRFDPARGTTILICA